MFQRPIFVAIAVATGLTAGHALAQSPPAEQRLALVIGQQAYGSGEVATALNDAGLIADTLKSAGFAVTEAGDLNQDDLRRAIRTFADDVRKAGKEAVSVVYFAGIGLQLEGENYLLPVDARVDSEADIPLEGFRVNDLLRALSATQAKLNVTIVDATPSPAPTLGRVELAGGLAMADAPERSLVAFAAAPNTLSAEVRGVYGEYAIALAEMMRRPGLPLEELFGDVRVRVHDVTEGAQLPWHDADLKGVRFAFFGQPKVAAPVATGTAPPRPKLRGLPVEEAYYRAIEADDIEVYQEFVELYPREPLSERVVVILANRRETVVWRESVRLNSREAYWTYVRLYPSGPHAVDARRRLARLNAPARPPERFRVVEFERLPRPLPVVERYEFRDSRVVRFEGPRVPRVKDDILPPAPRAFRDLREADGRAGRDARGARDGGERGSGRALPSPAVALPAPEAAPAQPGSVRSFEATGGDRRAPAAAPAAGAPPAPPQAAPPSSAEPRQPERTGPSQAAPAQPAPGRTEPDQRRAAPDGERNAPAQRAPETAAPAREAPTPPASAERPGPAQAPARAERPERPDGPRQARPERPERAPENARRERSDEDGERPTATTPPARLRDAPAERPGRSPAEPSAEPRERPQARTPAGEADAPARPARPQAVPDAPRQAPQAAPAEPPAPRRPAAEAVERPEPPARAAPGPRPDVGPGGDGARGPRGNGPGRGDGPGRRPGAD